MQRIPEFKPFQMKQSGANYERVGKPGFEIELSKLDQLNHQSGPAVEMTRPGFMDATTSSIASNVDSARSGTTTPTETQNKNCFSASESPIKEPTYYHPPKLNAHNLFAFRADGLTQAFTDMPDYGGFGQWVQKSQNRQQRTMSITSQTTIEEDQTYQNNGFWRSKEGLGSDLEAGSNSLDSSASSWTAEIFHNALCNLDNLDCDSDNEKNEVSSVISLKEQDTAIDSKDNSHTLHLTREMPQDSTQEEISFQSQSRHDILTQVSKKNLNLSGQQGIFNFNSSALDSSQTYSIQAQPSEKTKDQSVRVLFNENDAVEKSESTKHDLFKSLTKEEHEIVTQVDLHSYDQAGCRMIQRLLEDVSKCSKNFVYALIQSMFSILPDVMINQFGNYLVQKIIEVSGEKELRLIIQAVSARVTQTSLNVHGTRAIQALVEALANHSDSLEIEILRIIQDLRPKMLTLATDAHGNHVLQAFLVNFRASDRPQDRDIPGSEGNMKFTEFIFTACIEYCNEIGRHKHGCCVMQRCLEKGRTSQKVALADAIISQLANFIEDAFGNYLVQNVLKLQKAQCNEQIFKVIAKDFVRLSQLKFSSNVIEKCLECAQAESQIAKIFNGTHAVEDKTIERSLGIKGKNYAERIRFLVQKLALNQFGNYVLQKVISVLSEKSLKTQILESIKLCQSSLSQTKHGPRVLQKLQKTYPHVFGHTQIGAPSNKTPSKGPVAHHGQQSRQSTAKRGEHKRPAQSRTSL